MAKTHPSTDAMDWKCYYIGTLDVPRPSSRVEIVAAMRRIRYEFKAKAIKKKKVTITVSVDGVKVVLRKKKKKSQWPYDENRSLVMHHPIYRIFYVSHDSQDLKIWSYIARDGPSNVFKCNVFKAQKKSQAMRIVRTIGQAFEVCHKINVQTSPGERGPDDLNGSDKSDDSDRRATKNSGGVELVSENKELLKKEGELLEEVAAHKDSSTTKASPPSDLGGLLKPQQHPHLYEGGGLGGANSPVGGTTLSTPLGSPVMLGEGGLQEAPPLPLSSHHQMQLLRQQLEQQQHQTQVAIAQVHLLKDQLSAETAARIEAQARAHQLLLHNRDLLDHVTQLVTRVQELEMKVTGRSGSPDLVFHTPPQVPMLSDPTTPRPAPVYLPEFREMDTSYATSLGEHAMYENRKASALDADSPDSGHKEMSSESLSFNLTQSDSNGWHSLNGGGCFTPCSQPPSLPPPASSSSGGGGGGGVGASMGKTLNGNPFRNSYTGSVNSTNSQENSYAKKELMFEDKMKIITPMPLQDASGNRLELKFRDCNTPKIDPPPRFRRSRPTSNGTLDGMVVDLNVSASAASDSDYFSTYASSGTGISSTSNHHHHHHLHHGHGNGIPTGGGGGGGGGGSSSSQSCTPTNGVHGFALSNGVCNNNNGSSSSNRGSSRSPHSPHPPHPGYGESCYRPSASSSSSGYAMTTTTTMTTMTSGMQGKYDPVNVNDLNISSNKLPGGTSEYERWRMRISYTDDDNSDNSEESNTPSQHGPRRLDSMTFDEFDALSS